MFQMCVRFKKSSSVLLFLSWVSLWIKASARCIDVNVNIQNVEWLEDFCNKFFLHTMTFSLRLFYASGTRSTMSKCMYVFSIVSGMGRPSVCGLHSLANKVPIVRFSACFSLTFSIGKDDTLFICQTCWSILLIYLVNVSSEILLLRKQFIICIHF